MKYFLPAKKLNLEITNEQENIKKQEQKLKEEKCFTKDTKLRIISKNLKG